VKKLIVLLIVLLFASSADAQMVFYRYRMKADTLNYAGSLPVGALRDSIRAVTSGTITKLNIATGATATVPAWITSSALNTNRSTDAQATDTSAFKFYMTASGKPGILLIGPTSVATPLLNVDSTGKVTSAATFVQGSATVLDADDSTTVRTYSTALYYPKADTVGLKAQLLKNADSTHVRNYSSVLYYPKADTVGLKAQLLKNADSTHVRNYSNVLYQAKADTVLFYQFGAGAGNAGDTTSITTSSYYGSFFNKGSDTLCVTSLKCIMAHGIGTDTLGIVVAWDDSLGGTGAVSLNADTLGLNSIGTGNEDVAFANPKIPPGVWVWCKSPVVVVGQKPTYFSASLSGYKIRR